ncbi:hypothetical protein GUITHDRAFT_102529 [Guillardia theta CCMP2712]|uniref:Coenzyme Q-binding protein COQ10 START domain-containing protein n=1 Tax=Guillardia theta (strain CCMP2712) TaxID=905079 RepID=L1JTN0_GUITC|nr:hypothetical protein GUITHDRAFT_102529 [Guillardia theta CCMP2712]EKX51916.1 hypothetical protein GUITHDRAFT_102529 [Guillardia theta CCMP2712]|eukprot:XP_005838896.1 hypothetical protein GUITHDRAFT_102529 [Guillardia theta CCMP2712]
MNSRWDISVQEDKKFSENLEMDLDDDDNENKVEQSITIEASAQDCFTAATTYEDYPKWAGCTKAVKVLERRASDGLAVLVEFVMGIFGFTSRNKMKYTYDKPRCMSWHITEGGIKELDGRYDFISLGPERTKVVYKLRVEPGFFLPKMIKRATSRAVAKMALEDLKRFTEQRNQEKSLLEVENKDVCTTSESTTSPLRHLIPLC